MTKKHGLMIDMDGVIYAGEELIEGGEIFVRRLLKAKIPFTFLSNNSARSRREAVEKLEELGVKGITEEHIYTSAMATATFLKNEFPGCSAFVLGEGGLLKSLEHNGIKLVDKKPDFVILGEGMDFDLKDVRAAVDMILDGVRFIATNRDPTPRKAGWNNLGIAATAAMIEEGSGREAFVIGKPSPVMMRSASMYMGLKAEQITVIGDTMETDIIGGLYMGFKTVLVLSGIADKKQVDRYAYKPNLIVDSVDQIRFPLEWWS
ncbi:HAD-IIA family hydrolase [Mucilaginibacter conchicola]|uniref:HAD-IIA family hydrolase n=1 Tax=Mucilaginibacter conchicola TaxID=2303333 RepID=A0A372NQW5_9SPHI|nr:HAD-IIA family hydrolase [Mucilaginibacter conchicola]RFZ91322.1 HAD-IIA family hydrolase [Mucilaginibacter conchicola]